VLLEQQRVTGGLDFVFEPRFLLQIFPRLEFDRRAPPDGVGPAPDAEGFADEQLLGSPTVVLCQSTLFEPAFDRGGVLTNVLGDGLGRLAEQAELEAGSNRVD